MRTSTLSRTPAPKSDESPRGYLLRLAEANGYDTHRVFTDIAEGKKGYFITVGWDYNKLKPVLGPLCKLGADFGYRVSGKQTREGACLLGVPIHPGYLNLIHSRICTQCITELGYMPASWDMKAFVACPIHGTMMLTHCSACGESIKYARPGLLSCKCGAEFIDGALVAASTELLGLMEILDAKVSGVDSGFASAFRCGMPVKDLMKCDLDVLSRIFLGIGAVLINIDSGERKSKRNRDKRLQLPNVAKVFSSWPINFHKLCKNWHAQRKIDIGNENIFQSHFNWLFTRLHKNLKQSSNQTLFMLEVALAYGVRNWNCGSIRLREDALRRLKLPPRRFVTVTMAAKVLNVPVYTAQIWLRKGMLPAVRIGKEKEVRYPFSLIDLDELAKRKFTKEPKIGRHVAANMLELPLNVYKQLRKKGIIEQNYIVDQRGLVAIEDIEKFKERLLNAAVTRKNMHGLYSMSDAMNARLQPSVKVALIKSILDGSINLFSNGGSKLSDFYLEMNFVGDSIKKKGLDRTVINFSQAMRKFDLVREEVGAIYKHFTGSSPPVVRPTNDLIDVAHFEEFLKEYVSLNAIARDVGMNVKILEREVRRHNSDYIVKIPENAVRIGRGRILSRPFIRNENLALVKRIARKHGKLP